MTKKTGQRSEDLTLMQQQGEIVEYAHRLPGRNYYLLKYSVYPTKISRFVKGKEW